MTITPVAAHADDETPDTSGIDLDALAWDDPEAFIGLDREAVFAAMRAQHPVLWLSLIHI